MISRPKLSEAVQLALKLGFPPTTLALKPGQAAGHRLAKAVLLKNATPDRSFAVVHGLAVRSADVVRQHAKPDSPAVRQDGGRSFAGTDLTRVVELQPHQDAAADSAAEPAGTELVTLKLRSLPSGNRRDDNLGHGEAVAVMPGGTVPRGADMIYPFDLLAGTLGLADAPAPEPTPAPVEEEHDEDLAGLPVVAPPRDWLLAERFREGQLEVPLLAAKPEGTLVAFGAWARSRDPVIAERTILRAGELAQLEALGVDEVIVYRRPVIGVACLEEPRSDRGEQGDNGEQLWDPLLVLATQLVRSARVAALPLGRPPQKFRPLAKLARRWLEQVDILLFVGGSSTGHRCLGHDILSSMGEVAFAGVDLQPGGNTSLGTVGGKPVVAVPGSYADILAACVLLVRPLAHRYLTPTQYAGTVELELEYGSRLSVEQDTAVPVRFGPGPDGTGLSTRFSGRVRDPWLDYIRGQALVVLEGGRQYADGERVTAHTY